ncbi:MAG: glycosyltransferase family 2 protein, partial [Candidatus Gracilibacteria bacterium]
CIIPVYNEASRVGAVLDVLVGHDLIDEVIVVNDGSTDNSEEILANRQGIKLISYLQNKGKTGAMKLGFEAARNEWVMTIDSDLIGLDKNDISALILPIESGKADMTMTLRKNSLPIFRMFGLDFVSGERVFKKAIMGDLNQLEKLPGFGLESFLNQILIRDNLRLVVVDWPNVITPRKSVKFGFWKGVKADLKMIKEIISVLGFFGMFRQFLRMLKVKNSTRAQGSL